MRRELKIHLPAVELDALLDLPEGKPRAALTLAHGAGAGMFHKFMVELSSGLVSEGIAVLRFQFAYMQLGKKMPDPPKHAIAAVAGAQKLLAEECPGAPLFASGKSFGGRMSSMGAADGAFPQAKGLISFGYPLHPPGKPGIDRAAHLDRIRIPHLILQGDRDELAQLELLEGVCKGIPGITLHILKGADHSFDVLKSSGRARAEVMAELGREAARFMTA